MSELTFEQMLNESFKTIRTGEIVEGKVIDVKPDQIILNIGYKADGIVSRDDYSNQSGLDLTTAVNVGDSLEVKVLQINDGEGLVRLSHKSVAMDKGNEKIKEAFENKTVLSGPVVKILAGGLSVSVEGSLVFIPASLVADTFEKDLTKYLNQEVEFVIIEYTPSPRRSRIIGDRKQLLVSKKAELAEKLFSSINVGDVVEGTVKNVTDFGVFIDLGGADGLLHISEMSWGHVENPRKLFAPEQKVKVLIKEINGSKIALSMRFDDENPWVGAEEKFAVGNVVTGKVARMTDFGAFIELEPGIDALLHVSQISKDHIEKPSDVLKNGEEVTAKIVDFNIDTKKISLSVKALTEPEDAEEATEEAAEEAPAEETTEE